MLSCFSRPWELISALELSVSAAADNGSVDYSAVRYAISNGISEARHASTGEKLAGREIEWQRKTLTLYELPGPAIEGDSAVYEKIQMSERADVITDELNISYSRKMTADHKACFEALFNLAYFIRRDVLSADKIRPPIYYWEEVCGSLSAYSDDDGAGQAMIVDLARELPRYMDPIISHPKRALRRVRDLERIQRVREIDKACLIDLARRPGTGIAEKAGAKQRILAVRREETRNTLENRVVLHCCDLIQRAAKRYRSDPAHINLTDEQSARKKAVGKIDRTAKGWRRSESLQDVKALSVPCKQPNYVLLQNPHYSHVWNYYRQLVKNEEVRAKVWRWPRRLWGDVAATALADLIPKWIWAQGLPHNIPVVEERVASGLREFSQGRFLCDDIMPGPYILGRSDQDFGTLHIVDVAGLQSLYPEESRLKLLNMDYCMVWNTSAGRRLLPVYCLFDDQDNREESLLSEGSDASKHLLKVSRDVVGVLLVRPGNGAGSIQHTLVQDLMFGVWDLSVSLRPREMDSGIMSPAVSPLTWLMGNLS
jgi:hypothetical protein